MKLISASMSSARREDMLETSVVRGAKCKGRDVHCSHVDSECNMVLDTGKDIEV